MTRLFSIAAVAAAFAVAAPPALSAQHHHGKAKTAKAETSMKNIVQVASEAGTFKTLVTAVQAAGLVETLQGDGPFTVFAPTDAAFAKLPAGTIESLLNDKSALTAVLTFHVVAGKIGATDIVKRDLTRATTVNGQPLDIQVRGGKVYVNGAQVITADVPASNGVIHVIDTVLLPAPAPVGH